MWKEIPGYEGLYEASDQGEIRTVKNKTTSSKRFSKRVWKQRVMKQSTRIRHKNGKKDYMVTLWKNGKPHKYLVARLIAATYHENLLNSDYTVNHIDGDPCNNNANNLEWLTRAENVRYGFLNGQYSTGRKIYLKTEQGNTLDFNSFSSADHFLHRHNGYVSNKINRKHLVAYSKTGEKYYIEPQR